MKKSYFQNLQFCDVGFLHRASELYAKIEKSEKNEKNSMEKC